MECADDIAYGAHDLEDIVARRLVNEEEVKSELQEMLGSDTRIGSDDKGISLEEFMKGLFRGGSADRKELIGKLVNLFVTSAEIKPESDFSHPLLRYRLALTPKLSNFLLGLKKMTYKLVINRAEIQQLERRGRRIVGGLFHEMVRHPEQLIPDESWKSLDEADSRERRVCDYIAGMTDPFAEKIYQRLFLPGFGSSRDEL